MDQLAQVLEWFDLGVLQQAQRAPGFANENYFVESDRGAFVVKLLRERDGESVDSELAFIARLAENNFPVPHYLCNASGAVVFRDGDLAAVAMQRLAGEHPTRSEATSVEFGRMLTALHRMPVDNLPARNSYLSFGFVDSTLRALRSHVAAEELAPYEEVAASLSDLRRVADEGPRSIIHCDFTPANCLFEGDRMVAVLDWEEVTVGYPLLDLGISALALGYEDSVLDPDHLQALLTTYADHSDLSRAEFDQLPDAIRLAGLVFSLWVYIRWGVGSDDPYVVRMRRYYWECGLADLRVEI